MAWVAPLGLWRRTLAYLINFIAVPGLLWTIPGAIGAAVDPVGEQSDELSTGATAGYWVGLTLVAIYAVWNIRRAAVSGRSLGLKVAGGAALDEDTGLPIGVGRVLQRTWWVALACCYVGYLVPLSALGRPDRRTWTDRSARAVVVRFDQRESARRPRPVVARAGPPA